jgi:hypothetical protein
MFATPCDVLQRRFRPRANGAHVAVLGLFACDPAAMVATPRADTTAATKTTASTCNAAQRIATQHNALQRSTTRCYAAQHVAAQCGGLRRSATQQNGEHRE